MNWQILSAFFAQRKHTHKEYATSAEVQAISGDGTTHDHDADYSPLIHTHEHSDLTGLADDDHALYLTSVEGNAAYSALGHNHDHGALIGLGDDDHPQYHNNARGDARYSLLAHTHSGYAPIVGEVRAFSIAVSQLPAGWKSCDGTTILRSSALGVLYGANSYPFGQGDGSTTCNVPDLRKKIIRGIDPGFESTFVMAATAGADTHTLATNEIPSHNHSLDLYSISQTPHGHATSGVSGLPLGGSQASATTGSTGSGEAHNNLPAVVGLLYAVYTG